MLKWRIYYDNGSTWSNQDGPPEGSPACGVQAIVQMEPTRIIMHGGCPGPLHDGRMIDPSRKDFYCYNFANDAGLWTITDYIGYLDYLMMPGWKLVRFGRTIEIPKFVAIIRRAESDPDFPT